MGCGPFPRVFEPSGWITAWGSVEEIQHVNAEHSDGAWECACCGRMVLVFEWVWGNVYPAEADSQMEYGICDDCYRILRVPRHDVPRDLRIQRLLYEHGGGHAERWLHTRP